MVKTIEAIQEFCPICKKFYLADAGRLGAFAECPHGHPLLHPTSCQECEKTLYFQCDDDYCGPDGEHGIYCDDCATRMVQEANPPSITQSGVCQVISGEVVKND